MATERLSMRKTLEILRLKRELRQSNRQAPPGWTIERVTASSRTPRMRITSKEGQSRELPVSARSRPDPRAARQIPKDRPLLVTAPYLSQGVREAIEGPEERRFTLRGTKPVPAIRQAVPVANA